MNINTKKVKIGLIGYGYWGPNLARNFSRQPGCELTAICDSDEARLSVAQQDYPSSSMVTDSKDIFDAPDIQLVVIATPVNSHYELAKRALESGKDILVEKPLTDNEAHAAELAELAEKKGLILAVDHTFLFTPAVRKIREIIEDGEIGDIVYVDSVRVNLGLFQHDVNVVWDLAPHDLSILRFITGKNPSSIMATGHCYGLENNESVAYVHLKYDDGLFSHCHFNWMSPVKIRRMMICGTEKMIVYDDMEQTEKVKVYDKGITVKDTDPTEYSRINIGYRDGDILSPNLDTREALDLEAEHVLACVRDRKQPLVDGRFGLDIVRQLAECQKMIAPG